MRVILILSLIFFATPAFAKSATFSGRDLLDMCTSKYDTDYGFCAGFVSAIANAMINNAIGPDRACHVENLKSQQAIEIYTNYAELFPEMMREEASKAASAALARAFPCQ